MKTLYLDLSMGIAGDMLAAALLELTDDPEATCKELNGLQIPGVVYRAEKTKKNGIAGTSLHVLVHGEEEGEEHTHEGSDHPHSHTGMQSIEHIVRDHLNLSDRTKDTVLSVYEIIAQAESRVHDTSVTDVHFHEVGRMDAVADIAAVCYLMEKLAPERVLASPIHVGRGTVECAHGILPVPAPATTLILTGVPMYSTPEVEGELCTPTGAALAKRFAESFGPMPLFQLEKAGYGIGKRDYKNVGALRVLLGTTPEEEA